MALHVDQSIVQSAKLKLRFKNDDSEASAPKKLRVSVHATMPHPRGQHLVLLTQDGSHVGDLLPSPAALPRHKEHPLTDRVDELGVERVDELDFVLLLKVGLRLGLVGRFGLEVLLSRSDLTLPPLLPS